MSSFSFASPSSNIAPEHLRRTAQSISAEVRSRASRNASAFAPRPLQQHAFLFGDLAGPAREFEQDHRTARLAREDTLPVARSAHWTL